MNDVVFPDTLKDQEYIHLIKRPYKPKWSRAMANEIGRFFQIIIYIKGTDTFLFIHRHEVPRDRKVTYCRIIHNISS